MRRLALFISLLLCLKVSAQTVTEIESLPGEMWWGAVVNKGYVQPFTDFDVSDNHLHVGKDDLPCRFSFPTKGVISGATVPSPSASRAAG